jgi:hypothetical protein
MAVTAGNGLFLEPDGSNLASDVIVAKSRVPRPCPRSPTGLDLDLL